MTNWIKRSDQEPPKKYKAILACTVENYSVTVETKEDSFAMFDSWVWRPHFTHWMPLPEPPND